MIREIAGGDPLTLILLIELNKILVSIGGRDFLTHGCLLRGRRRTGDLRNLAHSAQATS